MFTKKRRVMLSILLIGAVFCVLAGYRIYDVNRRFPSPKEHAVQAGETFLYQGAEITAIGNKEVYTLDEMKEFYQMDGVLSAEAFESMKSFSGYYLCTDIEIKNPSFENINFNKGYDVIYWPYETADSFNGINYNSYTMFNYKNKTTIAPGEIQKVKLVYRINEPEKSREEILSETIRIIYSLYPEKNYIELGGVD